MTKFKKIVACGAALAMSVTTLNVSAQDDLDDLLKDLEGETKPAAKAETPKAEAAEEPAAEKAEEPAADVAESEEDEAKPAEEAETPKAEAAAKPAAEEATAEPVSNDEVDDVLNLLDQLAEETPKATSAAEKTEGAKPAAVAVAAKPKVARPDEELLVNLATTERLRRESLDGQAKREIVAARESMATKEFTEAVRHYGLATKLLNDSPASKALRKECEQGIAEGLYRAAFEEEEIGRRAKAVELMEKALEMRHPKARRALEEWTAKSDVDVSKTDFSEVTHRQDDADYQKDREGVRRHLRRARQYLALRDMSRSARYWRARRR